MPFATSLGIGAAAVFGVGVGARAFTPIIAPMLERVVLGARVGGKKIGGKWVGGTRAGGLWGATKFAARKGVWPAAKGARGPAWDMAKMATKGAFNVGLFAVRHPYLTMGTIGTGAYLATDTSPYDSPSLSGANLKTNFNEEQIAARALNESGIAPMGGITSGASIRNQRLMESTYGLTQGLHRSRH
ncbi:hypothetical protein DRQ25_13830 [Candidatus Fermentibacteria bacterium]|nr:MAG: hypothetical protein DRQ25_13830 [Candidatus Fermentibacteria bacterium]